MSTNQSMLIQALLVRWREGDESARQELIHHAYERLRRPQVVLAPRRIPRPPASLCAPRAWQFDEMVGAEEGGDGPRETRQESAVGATVHAVMGLLDGLLGRHPLPGLVYSVAAKR